MRRSKQWRRNDSSEEGPEAQRLSQCGLVKGVHLQRGAWEGLSSQGSGSHTYSLGKEVNVSLRQHTRLQPILGPQMLLLYSACYHLGSFV